MSKVSLNLGEIAQKNAIRSKLLADSDAWLAGVRDMIATMPEPTSNKPQSKPLNLAMGKKTKIENPTQREKERAANRELAAARERDYQMKLLGLARIWDKGANGKELAEFMGVNEHSISKHIKKCFEYGFIRSDRKQRGGNVERAEKSAKMAAKAVAMRKNGDSIALISQTLGVSFGSIRKYWRNAQEMEV